MKGPSVLALLSTFDVVWGIVIDDLHGIYLGVTLTLLRLWIDKGSRTKPYFIGNKVGLLVVSGPQVTRKMRKGSLSNRPASIYIAVHSGIY